MRKAILCLLPFIITVISFAQQNTPGPILLPDRYLEKSRSQKVAAFVLLGASAGLFMKGWATGIDEGGGAGFHVAGAASFAGSVVLFVAARRNKNKSRALSFAPLLKPERAPQPAPGGITAQSYPSLAVRVRL